jgi:hypothetical protein
LGSSANSTLLGRGSHKGLKVLCGNPEGFPHLTKIMLFLPSLRNMLWRPRVIHPGRRTEKTTASHRHPPTKPEWIDNRTQTNQRETMANRRHPQRRPGSYPSGRRTEKTTANHRQPPTKARVIVSPDPRAKHGAAGLYSLPYDTSVVRGEQQAGNPTAPRKRDNAGRRPGDGPSSKIDDRAQTNERETMANRRHPQRRPGSESYR